MPHTTETIQNDMGSLEERVDAAANGIAAGNHVLAERAVRTLINAVTELAALQKTQSARIDVLAHFTADPLDYVEARFAEACRNEVHAYRDPAKNLSPMPGVPYDCVEWHSGRRRLRVSGNRRGVVMIESLYDGSRVSSVPAFAATLNGDTLRGLWAWLHDFPRAAQ